MALNNHISSITLDIAGIATIAYMYAGETLASELRLIREYFAMSDPTRTPLCSVMHVYGSSFMTKTCGLHDIIIGLPLHDLPGSVIIHGKKTANSITRNIMLYADAMRHSFYSQKLILVTIFSIFLSTHLQSNQKAARHSARGEPISKIYRDISRNNSKLGNHIRKCDFTILFIIIVTSQLGKLRQDKQSSFSLMRKENYMLLLYCTFDVQANHLIDKQSHYNICICDIPLSHQITITNNTVLLHYRSII